jgi:hypothetical protein
MVFPGPEALLSVPQCLELNRMESGPVWLWLTLIRPVGTGGNVPGIPAGTFPQPSGMGEIVGGPPMVPVPNSVFSLFDLTGFMA